MLPPVDETVLTRNPVFATLYTVLTESILNPDGSTKNHPDQKEYDRIAADLKASRLRASKTYLLKTAIKNIELSQVVPKSNKVKSISPSEIGPCSDVIEFMVLLSNHLIPTSSSKPSHAAVQLVKYSSKWQSLQNLIPQISHLISTFLQSQALALLRIMNPTAGLSNPQKLIASLVPSVQARKDEIKKKRSKLNSQRMNLVEKVKLLSSLYHLASTLIILHLEQTVHGSLARELKLRSEFLSLSAEKLVIETKEIRLRGEKMFYTEARNDAFKKYAESLRIGQERLEQRKQKAECTLLAYRQGGDSETGKAKTMQSIAEKYAELKLELEGVTRDIERLNAQIKSH